MNVGKRRYKRYSVTDLDIHANMIFNAQIELSNISIGGACIKTVTRLKHGRNYLITLQNEWMHLPLMCTVIWEKLIMTIKDAYGDIVPVFKAGVQFKDVTSDKLIKLKDFMRVSGIPSEKKIDDVFGPSALRYNLYFNEQAVLNYIEDYTVKKISLGGMLIESKYDPCLEKRHSMALFLTGDKVPIKFQGRVASRIETPQRGLHRFDIGIEFLDMGAQDRARLSKFLCLLPDNEMMDKTSGLRREEVQ